MITGSGRHRLRFGLLGRRLGCERRRAAFKLRPSRGRFFRGCVRLRSRGRNRLFCRSDAWSFRSRFIDEHAGCRFRQFGIGRWSRRVRGGCRFRFPCNDYWCRRLGSVGSCDRFLRRSRRCFSGLRWRLWRTRLWRRQLRGGWRFRHCWLRCRRCRCFSRWSAAACDLQDPLPVGAVEKNRRYSDDDCEDDGESGERSWHRNATRPLFRIKQPSHDCSIPPRPRAQGRGTAAAPA